jgi:hypothetical protein
MAKRNFFYKRNWRSKTVRKNCFWTEVNGNKYLVSYQTVVCVISASGYLHKFWNDYSVTTMNQINAFMKLFHGAYDRNTDELLYGFNKKEWLEYETDKPIYDDIQEIRPLLPEIEYNDRNDYVKKIVY